MKKLTAGIFAGILTIVTVNAARADIATTNYVNGNVDAKVGTLSTLTTTAKDNAVAAINEVNTAAKAASTAAGTALTDAKAYAKSLDDATNEKVDANKSAIDVLNGNASVEGSVDQKISVATINIGSEISVLDGKVETLQGDAETKGSVANSIAAAVDKLDGKINGSGVVKTISQTDGVVTAELSKVTKTDLDDALTTEINGKMATTDYNTKTTMAADGTYAKTANTVGKNLEALDAGITTAANKALSDAKTYTDTKETAITTAYTNAINAAKNDIKTTTDDLTTKVNKNTDDITKLNGAATVPGSVDYKIKNAIDGVNDAAGALAGRVTENTNKINDIAKEGGTIDTKVAALKTEVKQTTDALGERVTANETAITNLTNNKANAADVYTKTEIDGKVTAINTEIGKKVTATNLQNKLLTTTAAGQLQDASTGLTKPDECGKNGVTCMLINDGTGFHWEKIVDTYK